MSKDFSEFFELLNKHDVDYLLVGGYAYAVHAEPLYTKDLGIFFRRDTENAEKILHVLADFGFQALDITSKDLTTPAQIIQLGYPPYRIDLINNIDGVTFDKARRNRITAKYGDETIFVIGKSDLGPVNTICMSLRRGPVWSRQDARSVLCWAHSSDRQRRMAEQGPGPSGCGPNRFMLRCEPLR